MKILILLFGLAAAALSQSVNEMQRRGLSMEPQAKPTVEHPAKRSTYVNYSLRNIPLDDPRFKNAIMSINAKARKIEAENKPKITIVQSIEGGMVLAHGEHSQKVFAIIAPALRVADGTVIEQYIEKTGALKEYIDTLGAKRTVDVYKAVDAPPAAIYNPAPYIKNMKQGANYDVEHSRKIITCDKCNGTGRVAIDGTGQKSKDGRMECSVCRGIGKLEEITYTRIMW